MNSAGQLARLALCFAAVCLAAGPVCAQTAAPPFQLVGFTTDTLRGDAGSIRMSQACADEFEYSRMCTSREVLATQMFPSDIAGKAWVMPSFVDGASTDSTDASGIAGSALDLSCNGWDQRSADGLTLDSFGRWAARSCDVTRFIACCAPVPIAVPEPSAMLMQGSGVAGLLILAKLRS